MKLKVLLQRLMGMRMVYKDPWLLLLIPFILGLVYVFCRRQSPPSFRFPSNALLKALPRTFKTKFYNIPFVLRMVALCLMIVALSGPRSVLEQNIHKTEGIDIVLAIDTSGSMAAEDFRMNGQRRNRLEIVKKVVEGFINERKNDRIGLVAFARFAYTICPLTSDYSWLIDNLERMHLGIIDDGTAVGSAIASSISRLKESKAKSRIIVLLTDGINNAGDVEPLTAARAAQTFGIKIYTIGAGTKGPVPFPAVDFFGRKVYQNVVLDVDDEMLQRIADVTGGKYFRATDTESLEETYKEIDKLEKTKIEQVGFKEYTELFNRFLWIALALLALEILLSNTIFLRIP